MTNEKRAQLAVGVLRTYITAIERQAGIVPYNYMRASGATCCRRCGFEFKDHPTHPTIDWITILCDGELVKL